MALAERHAAGGARAVDIGQTLEIDDGVGTSHSMERRVASHLQRVVHGQLEHVFEFTVKTQATSDPLLHRGTDSRHALSNVFVPAEHRRSPAIPLRPRRRAEERAGMDVDLHQALRPGRRRGGSAPRCRRRPPGPAIARPRSPGGGIRWRATSRTDRST